MSPSDENLPTIDPGLLDLLVDGELTDPQRRVLLVQLDAAPSGWRRCALAFLEAQGWREELRSIPRHAALPPQTAPAPRRRIRSRGRGTTLLAMASCFLIALGLGVLLRDAWHSRSQTGPKPLQLAASEDAEDSAAEPKAPESLPESGNTAGPVRYVTLPLAGGPEGGGDSIRLPATERESIDDAWPPSPATALPAGLLEALRRSGHRVHRLRGLMPFPMKDGRQLVVPYDEVEVRYVGHPAYQ